VVQPPAPAVLPKALFGNELTTHLVALRYGHGIPLGRLCAHLGLTLGSVIALLPRLAKLFPLVLPRLVVKYREAPVRHADETGWRTDGHSGYAWLFCTPTLSLFLFRPTRAAAVPQAVLGEQPLAGTLVVDRDSGDTTGRPVRSSTATPTPPWAGSRTWGKSSRANRKSPRSRGP
jgi:hypothetical protein